MDRRTRQTGATVRPALALDVANATTWLRCAFVARAEGRDPLPDVLRSRAAIQAEDVGDALGEALEALVRLTWDDPESLIEALWLTAELEADADTFATGANQ